MATLSINGSNCNFYTASTYTTTEPTSWTEITGTSTVVKAGWGKRFWIKVTPKTGYKNPRIQNNSVAWTLSTFSETLDSGIYYTDSNPSKEVSVTKKATSKTYVNRTGYLEYNLYAYDSDDNYAAMDLASNSTVTSEDLDFATSVSVTTIVDKPSKVFPNYYNHTETGTRTGIANCSDGSSETWITFGTATNTSHWRGKCTGEWEGSTSQTKTVTIPAGQTTATAYGTDIKTPISKEDIAGSGWSEKLEPAVTTPKMSGKYKYTKTGYHYSNWLNGGTVYEPNTSIYLYNYKVQPGTYYYNFTPNWIANELTYTGGTQSIDCSSNQQSITTNTASNGTGNYTYSISSQVDSNNKTVTYFTNYGVKLIIAGNAPKGTYTVIMKASDSESGATKEATWNITLIPLENSVTINPDSDYTLTYNGKAQQLVNSITAGGTAYVGLSNSNTSVPTTWTSGNSLANFTATNVGTYYIWVKAISDIYDDIEPTYKFKIEIKPAISVYNGSKWVPSTEVNVYNGVSWVPAKEIKVFDGNTWVDAK